VAAGAARPGAGVSTRDPGGWDGDGADPARARAVTPSWVS